MQKSFSCVKCDILHVYFLASFLLYSRYNAVAQPVQDVFWERRHIFKTMEINCCHSIYCFLLNRNRLPCKHSCSSAECEYVALMFVGVSPHSCRASSPQTLKFSFNMLDFHNRPLLCVFLEKRKAVLTAFCNIVPSPSPVL